MVSSLPDSGNSRVIAEESHPFVRRVVDTAVAVTSGFDDAFPTIAGNTERQQSVPRFFGQELILKPSSASSASDSYTSKFRLEQISAILDLTSSGLFASQAEDARQRLVARCGMPDDDQDDECNKQQSQYSVKFLSSKRLRENMLKHGQGDTDIEDEECVRAVAAVADFLVECKVLSNLAAHPSCCKVYGVRSETPLFDDGKDGCSRWIDFLFASQLRQSALFIITDAVDSTLEGRLCDWKGRTAHVPSISARLEVANDIASALVFLHSRQLAFYLTPAKVGFTRLGQIKLIDFSHVRHAKVGQNEQSSAGDAFLSRPSRAISMSEDIRQTLCYVAPEVVLLEASYPLNQKQVITLASDVYSYSIVLWEVASLRNPFESFGFAARADVADAIVHRKVRPDLHIFSSTKCAARTRLSRELIDLMPSSWHHSPELRPHMSQVQVTLENALLFASEDEEESRTEGSNSERDCAVEDLWPTDGTVHSRETALSAAPLRSSSTTSLQKVAEDARNRDGDDQASDGSADAVMSRGSSSSDEAVEPNLGLIKSHELRRTASMNFIPNNAGSNFTSPRRTSSNCGRRSSSSCVDSLMALSQSTVQEPDGKVRRFDLADGTPRGKEPSQPEHNQAMSPELRRTSSMSFIPDSTGSGFASPRRTSSNCGRRSSSSCVDTLMALSQSFGQEARHSDFVDATPSGEQVHGTQKDESNGDHYANRSDSRSSFEHVDSLLQLSQNVGNGSDHNLPQEPQKRAPAVENGDKIWQSPPPRQRRPKRPGQSPKPCNLSPNTAVTTTSSTGPLSRASSRGSTASSSPSPIASNASGSDDSRSTEDRRVSGRSGCVGSRRHSLSSADFGAPLLVSPRRPAGASPTQQQRRSTSDMPVSRQSPVPGTMAAKILCAGATATSQLPVTGASFSPRPTLSKKLQSSRRPHRRHTADSESLTDDIQRLITFELVDSASDNEDGKQPAIPASSHRRPSRRRHNSCHTEKAPGESSNRRSKERPVGGRPTKEHKSPRRRRRRHTSERDALNLDAEEAFLHGSGSSAERFEFSESNELSAALSGARRRAPKRSASFSSISTGALAKSRDGATFMGDNQNSVGCLDSLFLLSKEFTASQRAVDHLKTNDTSGEEDFNESAQSFELDTDDVEGAAAQTISAGGKRNNPRKPKTTDAEGSGLSSRHQRQQAPHESCSDLKYGERSSGSEDAGKDNPISRTPRRRARRHSSHYSHRRIGSPSRANASSLSPVKQAARPSRRSSDAGACTSARVDARVASENTQSPLHARLRRHASCHQVIARLEAGQAHQQPPGPFDGGNHFDQSQCFSSPKRLSTRSRRNSSGVAMTFESEVNKALDAAGHDDEGSPDGKVAYELVDQETSCDAARDKRLSSDRLPRRHSCDYRSTRNDSERQLAASGKRREASDQQLQVSPAPRLAASRRDSQRKSTRSPVRTSSHAKSSSAIAKSHRYVSDRTGLGHAGQRSDLIPLDRRNSSSRLSTRRSSSHLSRGNVNYQTTDQLEEDCPALERQPRKALSEELVPAAWEP